MDIFKDLKEIEDIYENLKEKVKDDHLTEVKGFKVKTVSKLEESIKIKRNLIESILNSITEEFRVYSQDFQVNYNRIVEDLEKEFQNNKQKIADLILKEMGIIF